MTKQRKVYAPFSLTSEAGVGQTPVEGYIDVSQQVQPILTTGSVNENGKWIGVKSSDEDFFGITKAVDVANTGEALFPDTPTIKLIDMTGFKTLQFALKTTRAGTYNVKAVFGPDTHTFANLDPIGSGQQIKIYDNQSISDEDIVNDNTNLDAANVWLVYTILADRAKGQKNMQIKVTNSAGGNATIDFAFRRLV